MTATPTRLFAGIITIGKVGDFAHADADNTPFPEANVRHLTLKDIEVVAAQKNLQFVNGPADVVDGEVLNQEDPTFCTQLPADTSEVRQGSCPGADNSPDGNNYTGGKWYFTVSGQQFPTVRVTNPDGEIWRLTNASGSLSYHLQLTNGATGAPMTMQLISVDGVSAHLPQDTPVGAMVTTTGGRFKVVPCAPAPVVGPSLAHDVPILLWSPFFLPLFHKTTNFKQLRERCLRRFFSASTLKVAHSFCIIGIVFATFTFEKIRA